jgi:hypothetical protein
MTSQETRRLLEHWTACHVTLGAPISPEAIREFEAANRVKLPLLLRDLYLTVNGFVPPNDQDKNGFSFWPLHEVKSVTELDFVKWRAREFAPSNYFAFADYLSLSWAYAIDLTETALGNRVFIVGTASGEPQLIAENFEDFVELYLVEEARLFPAAE